MTATAPLPASRAPLWRRSLLLFVLCFTVYNSNLRYLGAFDSLAASLLPSNLWRGDGLYLDRYANIPEEVRYSLYPSRQGHWISLYPIVTPLLAAPLYLPTTFFPALRPDAPARGNEVRVLTEKLAASVLAALSVLFVYWTLRRRASETTAAVLSLTYAFATSTWVISSQALWQHGPAELLFAVSLYLLLAAEPLGWRAALLGLTAALLTANRPHDLFFSAALAWIVLRRSGRRAWPFFVTSGALALLLFAYNRYFFTNILGGYVDYRTPQGDKLATHLPAPEAILGMLVSNRGLLVFCPFLLALFWLRPRPGREREEVAVFGLAWFSTILLHACFDNWPAGYCYGPRYLTDSLPLLFFYLAPAYERLRKTGRALFAAAALAGVFLQGIGAYCYPGGDSGSDQRSFWQIATSGPRLAFRAGLQSPHFLTLVAHPLVQRQLATAEAWRAEVAWAEPVPAEWPADRQRPLRVRLVNRGDSAWSSLGGLMAEDSIRWVVRWQAAGGPPQSRPLSDAWLAWRLPPGGTTERTIWVASPPAPGDYRLEIEPGQLVYGRWRPFSEHGAQPARAAVRVVPGG